MSKLKRVMNEAKYILAGIVVATAPMAILILLIITY